MANLFQRINDVINANINDLVDRLEDPERMIKQIIREMEDNILDCKNAVVDAITEEKKLQMTLQQHQNLAVQWQQKAESALLAGQDDLARSALLRKKEQDNLIAQLEPACVRAKNSSEQLKERLNLLQQKLEQAKQKRNNLLVRQQASIAQQQMSQTLNTFNTRLDTQSRFERMEDKVEMMEARTAAMLAVENEQSPVDKAFDQLLIENEVDHELAALKKKLTDK